MRINFNKFFIILFLFNLLFFSTLISDYFTDKLSWIRTVTDYNLAQYYASYYLEFLKRGLVGSLFSFFSVPVNPLTVFAFSLGVVNLIIIILYILSVSSFPSSGRENVFFMFLLAFVFSPATAQQFGNDIGRLDPVILLFMLISIWVALESKTKLLPYFLVTFTILALLIHEIYVFIGLPLVLFSLYIRSQCRVLLSLYVYLLSAVFFIMLIMLFYGGANIEETVHYLVQSTGLPQDRYPIAVWTSSLRENIIFTYAKYGELKTWITLFKGGMILLPYILLIAFLIRGKKLTRSVKLFLISPLAVLPLFIIGIDFSRWIGIMIFNILIMFVIIVRYLKNSNQDVHIPKQLWYILFFIVFTGPIGIT